MEQLQEIEEVISELHKEGYFDPLEKLVYPERFDASGKRIASNTDKKPDEAGSVLKDER